MIHSCSFSIIHGNQFQYLTFISDLTELWFNINQALSKLSVTWRHYSYKQVLNRCSENVLSVLVNDLFACLPMIAKYQPDSWFSFCIHHVKIWIWIKNFTSIFLMKYYIIENENENEKESSLHAFRCNNKFYGSFQSSKQFACIAFREECFQWIGKCNLQQLCERY